MPQVSSPDGAVVRYEQEVSGLTMAVTVHRGSLWGQRWAATNTWERTDETPWIRLLPEEPTGESDPAEPKQLRAAVEVARAYLKIPVTISRQLALLGISLKVNSDLRAAGLM